MSQKPSASPPLPLVGWREWVALPDLGLEGIKAKVDTGARTSSLHATDLRVARRDDRDVVEFTVYPHQRSRADPIRVTAPLVDERDVRSSSGESQRRPVIVTPIQIGESTFPVEFTLTRRDRMGFRMLIGRTALHRRFLVDVGRSYLQNPRPDTPDRTEPSP
ncbi:MAG: ATP-dependent zinc protease [Gemmatimonadales bacterium]|nr:MAG: ATP-dependent zinc protease [Gemmatimonadales bacterium]